MTEDKPFEVQFAELDARRAELEKELKATKKRLEELEPLVLNEWQRNGVNQIKAAGRTIYLERTLWACKRDSEQQPEELFSLLVTNGYEEYAQRGVGWGGLSALFRERDKDEDIPDDETVPTDLQKWFDVEERFKIRGRKAG